MKLTTTIKTLERNGFSVKAGPIHRSSFTGEMQAAPNEYIARRDGSTRRIQILRNGSDDDVATIRVIRDNDRDDSQSDYTAGCFCDTVKRAVELARLA